MRELLEKYLNGTATPDEAKRVDQWYDAIRKKDGPTVFTEEERKALREAYWSRLRTRMNGGRARHRYLWSKVAVAAALAGLMAMAYLYLLVPGVNQLQPAYSETAGASHPEVSTIENRTQAVRHFTLSDGSTVSLYPGSALGIADDFDVDERRVTLSGRASFNVSRNVLKPFYVIADEVVTKVLGTTFTVVAYPGEKEITVEVSSGAVSVYSHHGESVRELKGEGVILKPNQQAIYKRSDKKVLRTLVKEPKVILSDKEVERIRFEETAVSEIFRVLEKMYGVEIVFDEEAFAACSLTTSVSRNDLYAKMDAICEVTGARYSVEDGRIVIHGTGCN